LTYDRWYRRAAILLWPERRQFEVLCDDDGRRLIPMLVEMIAQWRRSGAEGSAPLKAQCGALAAAILTTWPAVPRPWHVRSFDRNRKEPEDVLPLLAALEDPELVGKYLGEVMVRDQTIEPSPALTSIGQEYGWATFRPALLALVRSTTARTLERDVRLLERVCTVSPGQAGWSELCAELAETLVTHLATIDRQSPRPSSGRSDLDRASVLAGLVRSLIAADQPALLELVLDHAMAQPELYPLLGVQMAALGSLQPWLAKNLRAPNATLSRWVAWCREGLEALTAEAPREPTDFRRSAEIRCKCQRCTGLKRFLESPSESVYRYAAAQADRGHLESTIESDRLDVACKTEEKGRPYTLVCTKTKASYEASRQAYQQNLEHLATVRAIEAALPRTEKPPEKKPRGRR
jgi:hypothetical protein